MTRWMHCQVAAGCKTIRVLESAESTGAAAIHMTVSDLHMDTGMCCSPKSKAPFGTIEKTSLGYGLLLAKSQSAWVDFGG